MPTLLRQKGYRFYHFSHEPNEPAHVHIDLGSATAKIWLEDLTIAKTRGFRAHELTALIKLTARHRDSFMEAWNEYFSETD